jgi:release factor glutamine methyltransferase
LAKSLPDADVWGVEKSAEALACARENAQLQAVRLTLCEGSLFEPLTGEQFNLIVSNPPYIPTGDLTDLQPEVRDYEPLGALDGGPDGLDFYRQIIPEAPLYLFPGGWLLLEVGIGQANPVEELFTRSGFSAIFRATDPGGIERVVGGKI